MFNKGLHQHRFKSNPDEKRFAELWDECNQEPGTPCRRVTLDYLLSETNDIAYVRDRDRVVAATVIQWLGSPVGQSFLEEAGFVKKENQ